MDDRPDGEPEEFVDGPHPLGVPPGQVVVYRDDVDALPGEGVEVDGHRGRQRFALPRLHLGDLPLVQDDPADDLDVKGPHADGTSRGFAHHGEGLGQDVVETGPVSELLAEGGRFRRQVGVGQPAQGRLEGVDLFEQGGQALQLPLVLAPDHVLQEIQHIFASKKNR